jgi:hypothetical protein
LGTSIALISYKMSQTFEVGPWTNVAGGNFMAPVPFSRTVFTDLGDAKTHMPDIIAYLIVFALGFASGYGVRDYVSRKRRREAAARRGS